MSKKLMNAILQGQGQVGGMVSEGNQSSKLVYPAVVISSDDPLGMKRVIARIVELDDNGNESGGRDRDTPTELLPFCVPLMPNHFHIVPIEGEMVYIILSNPSDNTAPRFYIGSQINSSFKLKFQGYKEAIDVFKNTEFNLNKDPKSTVGATSAFPRIGDIALQGRTDADLILRPREIFMVAGKFNKGTTNINIDNPANFQLIQKENPVDEEPDDIGAATGGLINTGGDDEKLIPRYSQANLTSSNINIFSILGKFRAAGIAEFEVNEDLKSFGDTANALHPAVFGDELIKLLDLIVRVLLNHIHTPQMPLVPSPESDEVSAYTVEGDLQRIISNHIRIN